eukprot:GHVP01053927.1.p1 GENE.GHVP01053927.1~~GHVP01053927.1.p1  ORF type:complete len:226 (+),score=63.70 GHVP01053927.1:149-826(+)
MNPSKEFWPRVEHTDSLDGADDLGEDEITELEEIFTAVASGEVTNKEAELDENSEEDGESSEQEEKKKSPSRKRPLEKRSTTASSRGSDGDSDEAFEETPSKAKKTSAKSSPRNATPEYSAKSLPEEKVEDIKKEIDKLAKLTKTNLSAMLKKNAQKVSGNKPDLVIRIAEGKVLGALPKCPQCNSGLLRFDQDTGMYTCPGTYEHGHMKECDFESEEVERIPWK